MKSTPNKGTFNVPSKVGSYKKGKETDESKSALRRSRHDRSSDNLNKSDIGIKSARITKKKKKPNLDQTMPVSRDSNEYFASSKTKTKAGKKDDDNIPSYMKSTRASFVGKDEEEEVKPKKTFLKRG